jgi:4'-phosphopantetheinyl transferase
MIPVPSEAEARVSLLFQEDAKDEALLARYRSLLTPEELARTARFHFERHRHQHLITRVLARTVLSGYCDVDPRDWRFGTHSYGRPHIAAPEALPRLSFNLAHTDGLIVCACATSTIGVDVEAVRTNAPLEIADRYFSAAEVAELRALPLDAQPERFFQYWTLKESYIKATGKGLSTPLDQFTFRLARAGHIELSFESGLNDDPRRWHSWLLEPAPGYLVAVTVERGPQRIVARKVVPLRSEEPLECRVIAESA